MDDNELAALRDAFPGYRFRRRFVRGVPCYLAEARPATPTPGPTLFSPSGPTCHSGERMATPARQPATTAM